MRKMSAPTSCQAGRADRKNGALLSPTARLTRVIALGVIGVHASRRVTAREIRRSKWRDMKPSLSFTRLRRSQASASAVSSGPASGNRPRASNEAGRRRSRSPSAAIRSSAVVARAASARTLPGSSVSTRATIDGSTESVSGSTDDSARARSQRAWTMTLAGHTMMRRQPGDPAATVGARARRRFPPRTATHRRGLRRGQGRSPARLPASAMRLSSGRPATGVRGPTARLPAGTIRSRPAARATVGSPAIFRSPSNAPRGRSTAMATATGRASHRPAGSTRARGSRP